MPHQAVHKSKDKKKSRSANGVELAYTRNLQDLDKALDNEEEILFGRITKKYNNSRFNANIYIPSKKNTLEIQVNIPYQTNCKLRTDIGNYVIVVQEGKRYEVFLTLSDEDARARKHHIHDSLRHSVNTTEADDCGIEFTYEDDEQKSTPQVEEDKKSKKDKAGKHKERVLLEGNEVDDDDDVDVDNI